MQDPEEFRGKLRSGFHEIMIQALDAKFVAGSEHLEMVVRQSWIATLRNASYAKKMDVDLALRVACDLQIARALRAVGLRRGTMDLAVIAIGDRDRLEPFFKFVRRIGEVSDEVLRLSPKKRRFLMQFHSLSEEAIKATLERRGKLAALLAERAALLRR